MSLCDHRLGKSVIDIRSQRGKRHRSGDLLLLSDDRLGRKPAVPNGPALVEPLQVELQDSLQGSTQEPLQDDRRQHPDAPAQKLRHPRNVRILPRSRDFH